VSLTVSVGPSFALLAAGAPLAQRWFVCRFDGPSRDPYFLYAASNAGSFLALALFPFLLEPYWPLREQTEIWSFAYLALTALLAFCVPVRIYDHAPPADRKIEAPTARQRLRWIALAMIPTSLLLSVTTHLTTDVAAIPLLWLIPMAIYLITFILVFAQRPLLPHAIVLRWLPMTAVVLIIVLLCESPDPLPLVMGVNLLGFFWLAMACHGELSRTRPAARHLTDFFFCLALGGVVGGAFTALIAPLIFPGLWEYPLMIVLACVFTLDHAMRPTRDDWGCALGIGLFALILVMAFQSADILPLDAGPMSVAAMFVAPLLVCFVMKHHAARFSLGIAAVLMASWFYHGVHGASAYRERSYFGIHRVTRDGDDHLLIHGNTIHGRQNFDARQRKEPLTYYSKSGPIGDVFRGLQNDARMKKVGAVGLGAGSIAAYSRQGQDWTFFEIDPSVKRIAQDARFFTFLKDAQGKIDIKLGDARLQLQKPRDLFGVLVVDAFGSDAIPIHLLTLEALAVYLDKLEPNGILAFHISNRYVDLEPVLANLAAKAQPPCVALVRRHQPTDEQKKQGIIGSEWLVIARNANDSAFLEGAGWRSARAQPSLRVWTDDFSNLFDVFRWRGE
jgi:hypothetical protein